MAIRFLVLFLGFLTAVGTRFGPERRTFNDPETGVRLTAITTHKARDNKIYQTHPSYTYDGKYIVFSSDRSGSAQLFVYRRADGVIVQITDDPQIQAGQVFVSRISNHLYYARGRAIIDLNLARILAGGAVGKQIRPEDYERKVCDLRRGWNLSGTFAVDADEKSLYLGLADKEKPRWAIHQIEAATGKTLHVTAVPFRVGHLQANPGKPGVLMFCHETGGDAPQRMYILQTPTGKPQPFYRETYNEWVTHEVWWGSDEALFTIWPYNPEMRGKPYGIARVRLADHSHEIVDAYPYWHVCGLPGGRYVVGDTMDGKLFLIDAHSKKRKLLTQGHRPKKATAHAHQSPSPDGKQVLFCSEMLGNWDLMLVDIPAWDELP